MVLALSGCDAGVVGTHMSVSSGHGVASAGHVCLCCQDAVSVLSGRGVGVIGMGCWCHRGAVLVSVSSGGRGPCHGHSHVACLIAILEISMRRDMICKCEGQQENRERTNHKSTTTKQQPVGTIYCQSVGQSVKSQMHLKTGGKRGGRCCSPPARPGKRQTMWQ